MRGFTRKRLAAGVLLIGLVLVGTRLFKKAPDKVPITFQYGKAQAGLRGAEINVYREPDDDHVIRLVYGYRDRPAPASESSTLKLKRAFYRFEIALDYPEETRTTARKIEIVGTNRILIDLSDAAWSP